MARHPRKAWMALSIGVALVLLAGVWVLQAFMSQPEGDAPKTPAMTTQTLNVRPLLIETSDALSRYVQGVTTGEVSEVSEKNIRYATGVDWNNERVVAIKYTLLDAKTVTGASIQNIDGTSAYVIDVLDELQCGSVAQVNSMHIAFIKQSGRDTNLPVILRTTPNTASCPDELR